MPLLSWGEDFPGLCLEMVRDAVIFIRLWWALCRTRLGVFFVPFSACVFIHLGPVGRPVWIVKSLGLRLLLFSVRGCAGLYPRLELGISYMYRWEALHSGWLIPGVGGALRALGLATVDGWEGMW